MANVVGNLVVKLSALTADFDNALKRSSSSLGSFGINLRSIFSGVSVAGFVQMARRMDDMSDSAQKLGISLHSYMMLENVAKQSATSIESVGVAINRMKRGIAEGKPEKLLGLSTDELKKLGVDKSFYKIAQSVAAIKDPMERTRVEVQLFGKSGAELDSVIQNLANNFRYWNESVADERSAKALAEAGQRIEDFTVKAEKLAVQSGGFLLDALDKSIAVYTGLFTGTHPVTIYENMKEDAEGVRRLANAHNAQGASIANATKLLQELQDRYNQLTDPRGAMLGKAEAEAGGNTGMVTQIMRIYDQIEAFKQAKKETENWDKHIEAVRKFGEELKKETLDPIEKFAERVKEIRDWQKEALRRHAKTGEGMPAELINRTAGRGIAEAQKNAVDQLTKGFGKNDIIPALVQGTREAYEAILRNGNNQELNEAKKTNQKLDEIKKKLDIAEANL